MSKRLLGLFFVLMLLVGGAAACGDDDGGDDSGDSASSEDSGDSGGDSGGGGGGSDEVEEYCQQAEDLGAELQAVIDDPTSGDLAAVQAEAQELIAAATELSTANPDDVDRITECGEALQVTP